MEKVVVYPFLIGLVWRFDGSLQTTGLRPQTSTALWPASQHVNRQDSHNDAQHNEVIVEHGWSMAVMEDDGMLLVKSRLIAVHPLKSVNGAGPVVRGSSNRRSDARSQGTRVTCFRPRAEPFAFPTLVQNLFMNNGYCTPSQGITHESSSFSIIFDTHTHRNSYAKKRDW